MQESSNYLKRDYSEFFLDSWCLEKENYKSKKGSDVFPLINKISILEVEAVTLVVVFGKEPAVLFQIISFSILLTNVSSEW